ncbi:MAG: DUF2393 family protein [Acidobacteriaceae bacterium]
MEPREPSKAQSSAVPLFTDPLPKRGFPAVTVAIAALAVTILAVVFYVVSRRSQPASPPRTLLPQAAYAANLPLTGLHMSESTSISGGKQTYIEGHIANHGPSTVTGATVQVVFANDVAMPPQIETVPLTLIYMRQPYIDSRPLSASPLPPGAEGDFRLTFDDVSDNWNQQLPTVRIIHVDTR